MTPILPTSLTHTPWGYVHWYTDDTEMWAFHPCDGKHHADSQCEQTPEDPNGRCSPVWLTAVPPNTGSSAIWEAFARSEHEALTRVRALRDDWLNRVKHANAAQRRAGGIHFRRPAWVNALRNRIRELDEALGGVSK